MPNLVGIGNSQVPTNAMLGGLAYQDSVGEIDIDKIKAKTSDTAVDIFVYDTRKDSDGGAWRKRATTQSWYNEGASEYRGARKEFPAVAIIVIETYELVIYDGDDPNLPMWMRFEFNELQSPIANMGKTPFGLGYTNAYPHNNLNLSCVHMLNGYLFIGANRDANSNQLQAGYDVNFISEIMHEYLHYPTNAAHVSKWRLAGKLIDRNRTDLSDSPTSRYGTGSVTSFKDMANDVDMIVLPNAPIDQFSGLPVPTVALATEGGASIIMNDGKTHSSGDGLDWSFVNISEANGGRKVLNYIFSIGGTVRHKFIDNISADFDRDYEDYPHSTASTSVASNGNSDVYGHSSGLMIYKRGNDPGSHNNADYDDSRAKVTSSFNSGYMHGDIKCAFLSDTDTTNISGSNLMSGATFNTSARLTSYSYTNGESTVVITDDPASVDGYVNLTLGGLTASTNYVITVTGNQSYTPTSGFNHHLGNTSDGTVYFEDDFVGTTTPQSLTFKTPSSGNPTIVLYSNYNGAITYTLDLRLAEFDRSPGSYSAYNSAQSATIGQKDGIGIYGTITKEPVATGAELVSYGPFSTSNRLRQPYNSNLRFETNDFYVMLWMNNSGTNDHETLVSKDEREFSVDILANTTYDRRFRIYAFNSSNSLQTFDSGNDPFLPNTWTHICVNFTGGNACAIYINGVLNNSGTLNYDIDSTSAGLNIGCRYEGGSYIHDADGTKLALVRIGKNPPSPEKVREIYNDERDLYNENAKCTLYGASDAITAITFDDSNGVLHAGTSAGRSEFQGLNRINNTTTAVTTVISASNGLVAEQ